MAIRDLVLAFDVLEHVPKAVALGFWRDVMRVLKPGARAVLRFPNGDFPFGLGHQNADVTHVNAIGRGSAVLGAVGAGRFAGATGSGSADAGRGPGFGLVPFSGVAGAPSAQSAGTCVLFWAVPRLTAVLPMWWLRCASLHPCGKLSGMFIAYRSWTRDVHAVMSDLKLDFTVCFIQFVDGALYLMLV